MDNGVFPKQFPVYRRRAVGCLFFDRGPFQPAIETGRYPKPLMRLYRQKRATLGQQGRFYALVGSVPHLRKQGACLGRQVAESLLRGGFYRLRKKAADSQLIILVWKAEGFLLASDFLRRAK